MSQAVVIKANNFGLLVILSGELSFPEIKEAVASKFKESASFFGNATMAISFEGRKLSPAEEDELITCILENSSLKISCVIDNDPVREKAFLQHIKAVEASQDVSMAKIHKGSFRSGMMMEFDSGVIVFGDVKPGAKIRARGNIIILGSLMGEAEAGIDGNDNTFIIALHMQPIQLRIGTKIARSADSSQISKPKEKMTVPHVAFVENGNIYVEELDKNILDSLPLSE